MYAIIQDTFNIKVGDKVLLNLDWNGQQVACISTHTVKAVGPSPHHPEEDHLLEVEF